MESIKETFSKIDPKHVKTGGVVFISLAILVLIILQFVGMGYATKVAFSVPRKSLDGKLCFDINQNDLNVIRFASIVLWIGVPFQLYRFYTLTCAEEKTSCVKEWLRYGYIALFTLEVIGLIVDLFQVESFLLQNSDIQFSSGNP